MTGSALRLEESRDGRCLLPRRENMTGSALRLEESRDGRLFAQRDFINWGRSGGGT